MCAPGKARTLSCRVLPARSQFQNIPGPSTRMRWMVNDILRKAAIWLFPSRERRTPGDTDAWQTIASDKPRGSPPWMSRVWTNLLEWWTSLLEWWTSLLEWWTSLLEWWTTFISWVGWSDFISKLCHISAPLSVHVEPQKQLANLSDLVTFKCVVSGFPVNKFTWYRDGRPLVFDDRIFVTEEGAVLKIMRMEIEDAGMFQCFVKGSQESAHGSAELSIGGESYIESDNFYWASFCKSFALEWMTWMYI